MSERLHRHRRLDETAHFIDAAGERSVRHPRGRDSSQDSPDETIGFSSSSDIEGSRHSRYAQGRNKELLLSGR